VFRVQTDIPPPVEAANPDYGKRKYPWYEMSVGDSFWVRGKTTAQIAASYAQVQRKTDMLFTSRRDGDGVRCWRIKTLVGALGLAGPMALWYVAWAMTTPFFPSIAGWQ
jgi:hypothetical protein